MQPIHELLARIRHDRAFGRASSRSAISIDAREQSAGCYFSRSSSRKASAASLNWRMSLGRCGGFRSTASGRFTATGSAFGSDQADRTDTPAISPTRCAPPVLPVAPGRENRYKQRVLLTITTTFQPATDLGHLLRKHPPRVHSVDLSFGRAHVFYPEATNDRNHSEIDIMRSVLLGALAFFTVPTALGLVAILIAVLVQRRSARPS